MESRARPPWMAEAQEQSSGRRFLLAVLVSTLWIAPTQPMHAAEPELRVIALKHRLANEVVPVVRPLLAPGESVNGMDSRLIVRASSRTFAQIEQVLAEIDKARRNLRIQVRHAGESGRLRESQGVTGDVRRGNTRIVNEASFTNNANSGTGVTIAGTGPGGVVQLHSERRITSTRDNSTQNLTVLDGGRAYLRVGESISE